MGWCRARGTGKIDAVRRWNPVCALGAALLVFGLGPPYARAAPGDVDTAPVSETPGDAETPREGEASEPGDASEAPASDGDAGPPLQRAAGLERPKPSEAPSPTIQPQPTATDSPAAEPRSSSPPVSARPRDPTRETETSPDQKKPREENAEPPEKPREYPLLVLAGGPLLGPHAFGNEECRPEVGKCEKTGTFFGLGVQTELRARLWKPLYAHVRGLFVGNVSPNSHVYDGAWGLGAGLGAYGRHIFGRAEYVFIDAFGDNAFAAPFTDEALGRDTWKQHAGVFSAGARWKFRPRLGAELWGGLMVGPQATRTFPDLEPDKRTLVTFQAGINLFYDLIPARPKT